MKVNTTDLQKRFEIALGNVSRVCRAHLGTAETHEQLAQDIQILNTAIQQAVQGFSKIEVPPKEALTPPKK
jgi:hypothetical protein